MKNYTNIYDIDGNLIRAAGDNHKFTIEEVEQMVDDLTEKVKNNPENEVYKVYLDNVNKYLMQMYNTMDRDELMKRLNIVQESIKNAQSEESEAEKAQLDEIAEAMNKLKEEYDNESKDPEMESLREDGNEGGMGDTMVEQPVEKPTVMDEYVDFEEV